MDFLSDEVGPEVDPATGKAVSGGGFTVTLRVKDLSDAALQQAMQDTASGSLLWVFRFANGYQSAAASARYSPAGGFSFGFNDYTTGSAQCGSDGEKCILYPGDKTIKGKVDQKAGTIVLSVPRSYLRALAGSTAAGQRPTETKATPGSRFYDATAFSLGNVSPDPTTQQWLYPADNTRAMDFLLPGASAPPAGQLGTPTAAELGASASKGATSKASRCTPARGFRSVAVKPRGRGLRIAFSRLRKARVTVDVFAVSHGRRVTGNHLVARFHRTRSFTWHGRANRKHAKVRDGSYFVRLSIPVGRRRDSRRVAVRRLHRRFRSEPAFYRRSSCGLITSFKLYRPVFGGSHNRSEFFTYRLGRSVRSLSVHVLRGKRVVKRYSTRHRRRTHTTYRLRLSPHHLRRASYRFRVSAVDTKGRRVTATLSARRL